MNKILIDHNGDNLYVGTSYDNSMGKSFQIHHMGHTYLNLREMYQSQGMKMGLDYKPGEVIPPDQPELDLGLDDLLEKAIKQ